MADRNLSQTQCYKQMHTRLNGISFVIDDRGNPSTCIIALKGTKQFASNSLVLSFFCFFHLSPTWGL